MLVEGAPCLWKEIRECEGEMRLALEKRNPSEGLKILLHHILCKSSFPPEHNLHVRKDFDDLVYLFISGT